MLLFNLVEYVAKRNLLEAAGKEGICHRNIPTYRYRLIKQLF
jgi:hypothetical protein